MLERLFKRDALKKKLIADSCASLRESVLPGQIGVINLISKVSTAGGLISLRTNCIQMCTASEKETLQEYIFPFKMAAGWVIIWQKLYMVSFAKISWQIKATFLSEDRAKPRSL